MESSFSGGFQTPRTIEIEDEFWMMNENWAKSRKHSLCFPFFSFFLISFDFISIFSPFFMFSSFCIIQADLGPRARTLMKSAHQWTCVTLTNKPWSIEKKPTWLTWTMRQKQETRHGWTDGYPDRSIEMQERIHKECLMKTASLQDNKCLKSRYQNYRRFWKEKRSNQILHLRRNIRKIVEWLISGVKLGGLKWPIWWKRRWELR